MKKYLLALPFVLLVFLCHSQDGNIKGIIASGKTPLELAAVQLTGDSFFKGVISFPDGSYEVKNIPPGMYTLRASLLGYKAASQEVEIRSGQTTKINLDLSEDRLNLNEVVVSATRYELGLQESPVMVKVLSPRLFNATQSMALSEGLHFQPGVRVETNCQNCGFTQVRLNGLEGAYSQILINSRPVFSALNSVYGLDQIPTSIIDRVEVVRSGGSALFGSNAIAGTINIITKEPIINTWQVSTNLALIDGAIPDNTLNFNASLVNKTMSSGVTFYGMHRDRKEWDANEDGFSELTRLKNITMGAKAFFKPADNSKITVDFSFINEYRRGGDRLHLLPHLTDITEELEHNTLISGLTYEQWSKDRRNKLSAYLSAQTTGRDSYYGGLGGSRTAQDSLAALNAYGRTEDLSLVAGLQLSRNFSSGDALIVGLENSLSDVRDEITGYNRLVDQRVNTVGLFGQYEWKPWDRMTALLGARFDFASVDGSYKLGNQIRNSDVQTNVFSPRLTILYDLTGDLQFRGGYARGFRAPQAFNEDLHISSVGGEPQFVILSENLEKELSDAFTASLNYSSVMGKTQANFLIEGFYTSLKNPFTIISTGAVLPNGSILEEVRNGTGAYVSGANYEISMTPSSAFLFQTGGTFQRSVYREAQVLFEPEAGSEEERVSTSRFVRNPDFYAYLTTNWSPNEHLAVDITGTYTGSMIVPRVVSSSGFLDMVNTNPFLDLNLKLTHHFDLKDNLHMELNGGVQNVLNSYQDDFDSGAARDSDYVYGPSRPRTFFVGVKIGNYH